MCEHKHHHGTKKDTTRTIRIILGLIFFAAAFQLDGGTRTAGFIIAYVLAGIDVLYKAIMHIKQGKVFDENFLMSIATIGAFGIKEYPEAVMVMILYQIGEYFQDLAVEKSRRSISELMDIRPDYANVEFEGKLIKKSPADIAVGDEIVVTSGEKIPLDGIVTEGSAVADTSALTGEPVPKELHIGDKAISGCINTNGYLKIKVEKEFGESTVSKILELVEHAGTKKAKSEKFITRFAKYYTPVVVLGAVLLAFLPPLITGDSFNIWLSRALTFLVISCPCALVISVPLGFFAGLGGASRHGILIKGSNYLEQLSNPDTVIFDKTGTLTKGKFEVTQIVPAEGYSEEEVLEYAAYAENYSNHPIALSLKNAYSKSIDKTKISNIEEIAGKGVKIELNGSVIFAGNAELMNKYEIKYLQPNTSGTIVYIAKNNTYAGSIIIADELKPDSINAITELKKSGIKTVILTGDSESSARDTATKTGVDKVYSNLLPANKVEKAEEIISTKTPGKSVIFAGDGINDAPVLTRADIGIAMGALGSDAAIEAADIVIMDDKPSKIPAAIKLAKRTIRIVKQNIIFAIGVKLIFLTLGAFGFMTMWGAVFADAGVALLAVLNSLRALK